MRKRRSGGRSLSIAKKDSGRGCGVLFFGVLVAISGALFWKLALLPLSLFVQGPFWVETPCTIFSSKLRTERNFDAPDTHLIDIKYDYTFNGQQYRGERYHFMREAGGDSTYDWKEAVIARFPPGLKTTCFVDPDDPSQSVIHRGFTLDMLWMLFPLPFLAFGMYGLLCAAGVLKLDERPASGIGPSRTRFSFRFAAGDDQSMAAGPVRLQPRESPLRKFVGAVFSVLLWFVLIAVFASVAVELQVIGQPHWFLIIFLIVFAILGLLLIWNVARAFTSLLIPRPTVVIERARIPLGSTVRLAWKFSRNAHIIRQLKVTLRGEECATFRRGTDTHTDKHAFHKEVLYETTDPLEIPEGEVEIRIPDDSMHSFEADNNKIVWEIHLDGEIPLRPDVDAEFPITVTPHEQYQRRNR